MNVPYNKFQHSQLVPANLPHIMGKEREPIEPHPLEGKYLVFQYTEADYNDEESYMLLYHVKGGKIQGIITPFDFGSHDSKDRDPTERAIERAIAYLQHFGINEVTVADFRGAKLSGFGMEYGQWDTLPEELENNPDSEEIENWAELSMLGEDSIEYEQLKEAGINVVYVDMRSDEIKASHKLVADFLGFPEDSLPFQPPE